MMEDFIENLHSYFSFFQTVKTERETLGTEARIPFETLINLHEQLQLIEKFDENGAELLQLPNLKKNLIAKIHFDIDKEFTLLHSLIEKYKNLIAQLESKELAVENSYLKAGCPQVLVPVSPKTPSVLDLMAWIGDITLYYKSFYNELAGSLHHCRFSSEQTSVLHKMFEEDSSHKEHILRIWTHTQFIADYGSS